MRSNFKPMQISKLKRGSDTLKLLEDVDYSLYDVKQDEDLFKDALDDMIAKEEDETEEPTEETENEYVGKVIVQCPVCMSIMYKSEEELPEVCEDNHIEEDCPYCDREGLVILGQIKAFEKCEEHNDEVEPEAQEGEAEVTEKEAEAEVKEEEPAKEVPAEEPITESVKNSPYKEIIKEYFNYDLDFDFLDIVSEILDRIDMDEVDNDYSIIYQAVDAELVAFKDRWDVFAHYYWADIENAVYNNAYNELCEDISSLVSKIKSGDKVEEKVTIKEAKEQGLIKDKEDIVRTDIILKEPIEEGCQKEETLNPDVYYIVSDGKNPRKSKVLLDKDEAIEVAKDNEMAKEVLRAEVKNNCLTTVVIWTKENGEVSEDLLKEQLNKLNEEKVDLKPRYDSRQSFYGKARVDEREDGSKVLYSYGSAVAYISPEGEVSVLRDGYATAYSSATTLRHFKEFLYQNNKEVASLRELQKMYPIIDARDVNA